MLTFQLKDGKTVEIDRQELEERILGGILDKLDEAKEKDSGMYTLLKSAVNMIVTMGRLDIKPPKGVSNFEYLILHYLSLGLDVLEREPLAVNGKVVEPHVQAD